MLKDIHKLALKIREELYGADNGITLSSLEALVSKIELVKHYLTVLFGISPSSGAIKIRGSLRVSIQSY